MSTADCDGSTESPWPGLPDELLGMVRGKLASPWARVRVATVCKAWHAASSRLPAQPDVPLLLVWNWVNASGPKRLCGPDGACVVRVPDKAETMGFVGSYQGGWVAATYKHYELVIVNLFSGAEVPLAPICSETLIRPRKIAFSEHPTSDGCILACIEKFKRSQIGLCKIGGDGSRWTEVYEEDSCTRKVRDIVFCNGELYALLDPREEMVRFKIDMEEDGTPVITSSNRLDIKPRHGPTREDDPFAYECHMVDLHGKPSMAVQTRWLPSHEPFFKVFTLVDTNSVGSYKYRWTEVTSFGEHALFLGPYGSEAVHVDEHYGLERNHIYYAEHTHKSSNTELLDEAVYSVTIANSQHMYRKEDQIVGDGLKRIGYYVTGCNNLGMWIYPPNL